MASEHVDGDSGDEGVLKHGIHVVSDFLHGRKHVHHHEHEHDGHGHEHEHGNGHTHSPAKTPSKPSFEEKPHHLEPREELPVHVHPHAPAPAPKVEQHIPGEFEEKKVPVPVPAPVPVPVVVPVGPVTVPEKLRGPVLEAPYHLYCWGTPDSVTKSTSYTVSALPSSLLKQDSTFSVSARTEQDGPRAILSVESSFASSLFWLGTERTNLVHAQWVGSPGAGAGGAPHRVAWHEGWTVLVLVWSVSSKALTVYRDGDQVFSAPLEEEALRIAGSAAHLSLVLGRAKEGGRRALGWDGEIADAKVWDRALGEGEIRALRAPEEVHPGYESAWNSGKA
ncbi:hypothetical protein CALVIDRAFT_532757 [Calocera viscosa TUFC12733]|uniref:Concanavalin A-like lectin/glucanase n=1 Tax=Calocera viscosa (strain TUFC12733) TaxID=1330018 RepID=A0A167RPU8_CALVF|nr:hypothetical protein CALVIDRAFT_532757 [Calocera viscosa TUFC12733]